MQEMTRTEELRYWAGRTWRKLRYRMELAVELAAGLVLIGALGWGIYTATHGDPWGGGYWIAGALVVLVAWGKANASEYRYERWWRREREERHALIAQTIHEEE